MEFCHDAILNPNYALGIKELVNLLTNPSDCQGLTLTILTIPSLFFKLCNRIFYCIITVEGHKKTEGGCLRFSAL